MSAAARFGLAIAGIVLATSPAACSVPALQGAEYTGPKNTCNAGCSGGATCVDGACKANRTAYKMLLEVTPPSSAHYASDVTFPIDLGSGTGGDHELHLEELAQVTISIDASGVPGVVRSIPLAMHLTRIGELPGLAATTYDARSETGASFLPGKGSVSIAVPPGDYNVYLTPLEPDSLGVMPPLDLGLVKASLGHFTSGPQERVVVVNALKAFSLTITDEQGAAPLTEAVDGYDVSVVDRTTGRVVSTIDRTCTHPGSARLLLSPGLEQHTYSVRFSPPSEKCDPSTDPPIRPTYDFDLDALNVDGTSVGTVAMPRVSTLQSKTDGKSAPVTVNVGGFVKNKRAGGGETPVKAALVFRSRKLSIPTTWKTGTAFYEATGSTSTDDGSINSLQLPAGQYDIQIVPSLIDTNSNAFAIGVAEHRDLTATNNTLDLTVTSKTVVRGAPISSERLVFELGNADFLSASAKAVTTGSVFAPLARSKSVTLGKTGFSTALDPGRYDLVVRIPEESGYAWIVSPNLDIATPSSTAGVAEGCSAGIVCLNQLQAAAPVVLTGKVLDPYGDPVARATMRARALVFEGDPDTTSAVRAVVVGETKSEEDGSYVLVVPSDFVKTVTAVR
jgi:hypothetical protein